MIFCSTVPQRKQRGFSLETSFPAQTIYSNAYQVRNLIPNRHPFSNWLYYPHLVAKGLTSNEIGVYCHSVLPWMCNAYIFSGDTEQFDSSNCDYVYLGTVFECFTMWEKSYLSSRVLMTDLVIQITLCFGSLLEMTEPMRKILDVIKNWKMSKLQTLCRNTSSFSKIVLKDCHRQWKSRRARNDRLYLLLKRIM